MSHVITTHFRLDESSLVFSSTCDQVEHNFRRILNDCPLSGRARRRINREQSC